MTTQVQTLDCEQARRLLPLSIGHDLANASDEEALRGHVATCPPCSQRQQQLQQSLDLLQSVAAATLTGAESRPSLWSRVAAQLPARERARGYDRFNGWIPALAMSLAVVLMVAVSINSVQRELGVQHSIAWSLRPATPSDGRDFFAKNPATDVPIATHPLDKSPMNPWQRRSIEGTPVSGPPVNEWNW